jgi:hypothetical protein
MPNAKILLPSWREAFFMLTSFTTVSAFIWVALYASLAHQDVGYVESWLDLWNRCREWVEQDHPINLLNLEPTETVSYPGSLPKGVQGFAGPGAPFALFEYEDGGRRCDVVPVDWSKPINERQAGLLAMAFLRQRQNLVARGTHAIRDTYIIDVVAIGFTLALPNRSGCSVAAMIISDPSSMTFTSSVWEMWDQPCTTNSDPPATPSPEPAI